MITQEEFEEMGFVTDEASVSPYDGYKNKFTLDLAMGHLMKGHDRTKIFVLREGFCVEIVLEIHNSYNYGKKEVGFKGRCEDVYFFKLILRSILRAYPADLPTQFENYKDYHRVTLTEIPLKDKSMEEVAMSIFAKRGLSIGGYITYLAGDKRGWTDLLYYRLEGEYLRFDDKIFKVTIEKTEESSDDPNTEKTFFFKFSDGFKLNDALLYLLQDEKDFG